MYFSADTPFSFDVCAMFVKTKEHCYPDVPVYTKQFAPGLQWLSAFSRKGIVLASRASFSEDDIYPHTANPKSIH
jgi:hypothetical protein